MTWLILFTHFALYEGVRFSLQFYMDFMLNLTSTETYSLLLHPQESEMWNANLFLLKLC